jgi:hypothetical protein
MRPEDLWDRHSEGSREHPDVAGLDVGFYTISTAAPKAVRRGAHRS